MKPYLYAYAPRNFYGVLSMMAGSSSTYAANVWTTKLVAGSEIESESRAL
jgi:hypothetical protein